MPSRKLLRKNMGGKMTWILIVWFGVGIGGYGRGMAVNFQEFNTQESCESALKVIQDNTKIGWNGSYNTIDGGCVKK